jgi:hypothetical protein
MGAINKDTLAIYLYTGYWKSTHDGRVYNFAPLPIPDEIDKNELNKAIKQWPIEVEASFGSVFDENFTLIALSLYWAFDVTLENKDEAKLPIGTYLVVSGAQLCLLEDVSTINELHFVATNGDNVIFTKTPYKNS